MKHGRTSVVNFLSQLAMSFSGFIATIVLTRTLGQEQYGTYVLVLSVLSWVAILGKFGLHSAVQKRVSESDGGNYIISGLAIQAVLYPAIAIVLWISRPYLNEYLGAEATLVLLVLLAARIGIDFTRAVLNGQHLVHISSILSPVEWTLRSIVQIVFVVSGFGIAGAFFGYVVGAVFAAVIGLYFVSVPRTLPSRREFVRLKSYAQFSWFSSIKRRTFLSMDTIVLAFFVSNGVIAVYEIAWNLASLFAIFSASISTTLFPAMSSISSRDHSNEQITKLLRESLTYAGLFIVPGLVGSAIVGDVILTIYGPGFTAGYHILLILIFARLLYGYMDQLLTTVDAIDKPNLTFRVNTTFVVVNLGLNVILTWQFGWYGTAAATTASVAVGLLLSYYYATQVVNVILPLHEIGKQWAAAGIMGITVFGGRVIIGSSLLSAIALAIFGAGVYFSVLLAISPKFRMTVDDNLPNGVSIPISK
ncbi:polysaccharide biosynthesis protein [Haloferax larsenii JCM 13917]|nr:oligosaccharide flippase family protein [Haloferax larsenii]ELZ81335.1 polysaccharide biosynthesis protein [Haloferax larsenii JCM 13917]